MPGAGGVADEAGVAGIAAAEISTCRSRTTRRELLRGAAAGVAGFALPGLAPIALAQNGGAGVGTGAAAGANAGSGTSAGAAHAVTALGEGLTMLTGGGVNLLAQMTAEGMVLIDSGTAASRPALHAWLAEQGADRIAAVINTHWHPEQVGANETFGAAGARVIAHEKTRQRLHAGYYLPDEDRYAPALVPAGLPTETFYESDTKTIGDLRFDLGYLIEAHTDGDIHVALPARNLIAVGDAVSPARDPILDWYGGGWLGGRLDALEALLAIGDGDTRYVPSFGPVVGRAELQAEHAMLLNLFDRFVEHIRLGESVRDMLEAGVHEGLGREIADPYRLISDCYQGFWAHHNALMHDIV